METTLIPTTRSRRACRPIEISRVSYGKRAEVTITRNPRASVVIPGEETAFMAGSTVFAKRCLVDLQFYHPSARSVCVVGTFGKGKSRTIPLEDLGGGAWLARVILPPGRYEYRFLADGKPKPDPLATEFSYDASGELNSVMLVE